MLHHHLPMLLSRLAPYGRHVVDLYHGAVRLVELGLCRLSGSPPRLRSGFKSAPERFGRETFSKKISWREPLLIHYHIFKNAGTSFEWALQQALGRAYRSFDSPLPNGFVSARDLIAFSVRNPEVRAISSHQAAPPGPRFPRRHLLASILIRDPIARIRSIYAFERFQASSSPGATKAKELTFKQYVEWRLETSPSLFCNFQVQFCSRKAADQPRFATQGDLERALANLDSISVVGTVARYDEWLALAQKILSGAFPGLSLPSTRQNTTIVTEPSKAEILDHLIGDLGHATADYLLENNELDMCLHQVADALLTRRLAEHGVDLSLRRAYANAQRGRQLSAEASHLKG